MYQHITIIGNVGRDPEMRYTAEGVGVCSFTVAVNKRYKRSDGQQVDKTTWFRVSAWRQLAEVCSQYVHKGMQIMVAGEVEANAFTGNDGQPRASLELTARDIKFLSRRDDAGGDSYEGSEEYAAEDVDDIPF
ncbi:MAG: single-stranded DNA-binding protein [Chloroflexi bacterium]|nr:single-stranded DNA-binding protein [Chloroflexota bacterium]